MIEAQLGGVPGLSVAVQDTAGLTQLILTSDAGPITTDLDFETTLFSDSSQQEVTFVAIPSGLEDGDTLELQINSVDLAAPALTVTVVDGDTQETVANSLQTEIADLGLGLSAEIVVADPQDPDAPTGIQITAPPGVDLASAELSLSSEILGS